MVTIKEAEMQTGITRQNIRYYEKIGLLQPSREQENKYRNYSEEDIRRLKLILLFRKLDMPLEEIRQLLEGTIELQDALQMQKEMLVERQQKLQAGNFFLRTDRREGAYAAGRGQVFKQNKNRGEKWTLFCRYSSGL